MIISHPAFSCNLICPKCDSDHTHFELNDMGHYALDGLPHPIKFRDSCWIANNGHGLVVEGRCTYCNTPLEFYWEIEKAVYPTPMISEAKDYGDGYPSFRFGCPHCGGDPENITDNFEGWFGGQVAPPIFWLNHTPHTIVTCHEGDKCNPVCTLKLMKVHGEW